jgi:hypothetical protein
MTRPEPDAKAAVEAVASADVAELIALYSRNGGSYGKQPDRLSSDPDRDQRMRMALAAAGGWYTLRSAMTSEDDGFGLSAFRRAYVQACRAQAHEWPVSAPEAVRRIGQEADAPRAIAGPVVRTPVDRLRLVRSSDPPGEEARAFVREALGSKGRDG